MNPSPWNLGVWLGGWLGSFVILESLAVFGRFVGIHVPWDAFSRFVWDLQVRYEWVTVPVVAILAILLFHMSRFAGIAEGDRLEQLDKRLGAAEMKLSQKRMAVINRRLQAR